MRFDPTGMTQAEIDSLSEAYNQMVMGNQPTKPQTANYIADAGEPIPQFVPPQDSTGALGINPDTGDTFLPNEPPPQLQTGNDFDTRPQVYGNPYGIQGGPQMGAGKGGYRPPMYGGGFGGPQYGNPYGGGFGRPPMGGGKGGGRPPMYGNPYGGGFGGGFGRPPMGGGFGPRFNNMGGGFGGRMAAPGYNLGTGTFGGGFPNPYASQQYRQDVARSGIPPGFVPSEMQTGNSRGYINPQTGETMSIPVDFSGGATGSPSLTDASGLPPGYRTLTGGMIGTTNPDGTTTVGAGQLPQSDQLLGSGIAGLNLAGGNQQPTNPYSTGYGMGYQQQPNQQPNQQPMGGGKGGTQSGGGKGGAQ
jgi:hypothetical protein